MDENIKESIRKFQMQKSASISTFITDIRPTKKQNIKKKNDLDNCIFNVSLNLLIEAKKALQRPASNEKR